jgi:hypothetical protein
LSSQCSARRYHWLQHSLCLVGFYRKHPALPWPPGPYPATVFPFQCPSRSLLVLGLLLRVLLRDVSRPDRSDPLYYLPQFMISSNKSVLLIHLAASTRGLVIDSARLCRPSGFTTYGNLSRTSLAVRCYCLYLVQLSEGIACDQPIDGHEAKPATSFPNPHLNMVVGSASSRSLPYHAFLM